MSGAALLLVAIALAWLASRTLAGRIAALAAAADRLRSLDTDSSPVPQSRVRELNNAADAFNAMSGALAWFVTYVPRSLVVRLMQRGSAATVTQTVDATVIFTDIRGFSTLAQDLPAGAAADSLNHHFELLAAEIEATGGTVDKYIGDGMMAFWSAPEPRADHAGPSPPPRRSARRSLPTICAAMPTVFRRSPCASACTAAPSWSAISAAARASTTPSSAAR